MLSKKNSQDVLKDLGFLKIALLWNAGTQILCIFNR